MPPYSRIDLSWTPGPAYNGRVSSVPQPIEPAGLTVLPPDEALKRALPLPSDEDMRIEGLTEAEWAAFERALADR